MGHIRQVQTAWHLYAVDHGDHIVNGQRAFGSTERPNYGKPWLIGGQWGYYTSQREVEAAMRMGALAPYTRDIRAYSCPARPRLKSRKGWSYAMNWYSSYGIVKSMNVSAPEDWLKWDHAFRAKYDVGRTVLFVRKTSELVDPGPAARAVFVDGGGWAMTDGPWISELWELDGFNYIPIAPIHHSNGTNLSFSDGHVEYWRWAERDTIRFSWEMTYNYYSVPDVNGPSQTEGVTTHLPKPNNPDYVRFFRAVWGKWPARLDASAK